MNSLHQLGRKSTTFSRKKKVYYNRIKYPRHQESKHTKNRKICNKSRPHTLYIQRIKNQSKNHEKPHLT